MKKRGIILVLSVSMCLLAACGSKSKSEDSTSVNPAKTNESTSLQSEETSQSVEESSHTDVLYAVFNSDLDKEYPIEYEGEKKNAEELAEELSELTGMDFIITATKTDDGLIVDWDSDSTLIAGVNDREQKEEFYFYDYDSQSWFMMDSLWKTLAENLDAENIYYTMDGGQKLVLEKMSPIFEIPSDTPYMGSEFYAAHDDVKGDIDIEEACQGIWEYPDGKILEIEGETWNLYEEDGVTLIASGPMHCTDDIVHLSREEGSAGGGVLFFDENNNFVDSGMVLTRHN